MTVLWERFVFLLATFVVLYFIPTTLITESYLHDQSLANAVDCPPEWTENHASSCYIFSKKSMKWGDADAFCSSHGGHLAIVNNKEEQTFMDNYLKRHEAEYGATVWLDGSDLEVEGHWYWDHTGVDIDSKHYTNWRPNEPNNLGGHENCMEYGRVYQYHWNDIPCDHVIQFICEKDEF